MYSQAVKITTEDLHEKVCLPAVSWRLSVDERTADSLAQ